MTNAEFRESKEYKESVEKIKNYPVGFRFTLKFAEIPKSKWKALEIITRDCIDMGILESVSIGLGLMGNLVEEEYERVNKEKGA